MFALTWTSDYLLNFDGSLPYSIEVFIKVSAADIWGKQQFGFKVGIEICFVFFLTELFECERCFKDGLIIRCQVRDDWQRLELLWGSCTYRRYFWQSAKRACTVQYICCFVGNWRNHHSQHLGRTRFDLLDFIIDLIDALLGLLSENFKISSHFFDFIVDCCHLCFESS
jgi:hypothetical protein